VKLVQAFASVFKHKIPLVPILALGWIACTDIPRDNPLDPKNNDSIRPQIVSLDVFVNTSNDLDYNERMLSAVDQLEQKYGTEITVAEYHRNIPGYPDSLARDESEILYETYVNAYAPDTKGVPDVFLNGTTDRVQGAFSTANALLRLEQSLQPLLLQNSYYTLEPKLSRNGDLLTIEAKLARLGATAAENILLKAILVQKIDNQYLKRVVRRILISDTILEISAGEVKTISLGSVSILSNSDYRIILNVTLGDGIAIYQSLGTDVP
jgi:hypothetical protein